MDSATLIAIIDHHPLEQPTTSNVTFEGRVVGATTTLLVERIRESGLSVTPLGPSLMLMGIYQDTGSLSYLTTTASDAEAAAWLLQQGADVALVGEFLSRPLTADQRSVLARLMAATTVETHQGARHRHRDGGARPLCGRALFAHSPTSWTPLSQRPASCWRSSRTTCRSSRAAPPTPWTWRCSCAALAEAGSSKAAAALVEGANLEQVQTQLRAALQDSVTPPVSVRQIMSTNVHTLKADMLVHDAGNSCGATATRAFRWWTASAWWASSRGARSTAPCTTA